MYYPRNQHGLHQRQSHLFYQDLQGKVIRNCLQNYQKNINSLAQAFGARNANAIVTNVARAPRSQFLRAYANFIRDHANLSNTLNTKLRSMAGTNANAAVKLSMKQAQNARRAEMNLS
jgi:phospholipase/lecithinase/hemolysin